MWPASGCSSTSLVRSWRCSTGQPVRCARRQVFVAVLGASSYTYAEAVWSQSLPDWISAHVNALAFFDGVPRQIVCDNLRSGITRACFYEPLVNRTYADMARHYGTAVIPARPYKARDKAKVEVGVQVVQRWILARLRHQRFFSLAELNSAIHALLVQLNDRLMRGWGTNRRALYQQVDRPALQQLPPAHFEYAEWKRCRVNLDYHVEIERHYYSVPFQLLRQRVEARLDPSFAVAKAVLAAYLLNTRRSPDAEPEAVTRAAALLSDAAAVRPESLKVLAVSVYLLRTQWHWSEALAMAQRMMDLYPKDAEAYNQLATMKFATGAIEEAIPLQEDSIRLNPRDPFLHERYQRIGYAMLILDREQRSIPWFKRSLASDPDMPQNESAKDYRGLAVAYASGGHAEERKRGIG